MHLPSTCRVLPATTTVHCCAPVPLHVYIWIGLRLAVLDERSSRHRPPYPVMALPFGGGSTPPPPPNGVSVMPADVGLPSLTMDAKLATSSNGNAYAFPSIMFAWMIFAYWS